MKKDVANFAPGVLYGNLEGGKAGSDLYETEININH